MIDCHGDVCPEWQICKDGIKCLRAAVIEGRVADRRVPQCLLTLGLLQPLPDEPDQLAAVPPSAAAAVALRPHERLAAEVAQTLRTLSVTYDAAEAAFVAARQELAPDTVTLRGLETINRVVDAAVTRCRSELMTAQPGGGRPQVILDALVTRSLETIRRGVHQRTIYQHAVRAHRPTIDYILGIIEAGAEVRTVDKVFDRLIICDRSVAFIPIHSFQDGAALEIHNPAVVAFLVKVFEHTWDRGIVVDVSTGFRPEGVLTDIERSVARMIVSGSTEDKIARNLGISRRTVAEYASRLARHLGSSSRAQLGYMIATQGLLAEAESLPEELQVLD